MATARILLLLLCTTPAFGYWLPHRHLLSAPQAYARAEHISHTDSTAGAVQRIIMLAEQQLPVRELHGRNDGVAVESYLRYVGLGKGHAWCAAFVSWLHGQLGYAQPRSGWSPALFPASRRISTARAGAILGIYLPSWKRIAHVGLVSGTRKDWVASIEGNTNPAGSREGDGVYRRMRHRWAIHHYAFFL